MSSCEVYQTLYGQPPNQTMVQVPSENESVVEGIKIVTEEIPIEGSDAAKSAIIVDETNLVNLEPKAEDPDRDSLLFTFTSPLDENGQWQTTYGDEGAYTVTITASDGELTASKEVLLIVKKKEEAPSIGSQKPVESTVFVDEGTKTEFSIEAVDLNKDVLSYEWKLDGEAVSEDVLFEYSPDYDDEGSHTLKVDVSDGVSVASSLWSITVNNVNRVPMLNDIPGITAKEDEEITIVLDAYDEDGDELTYSIDSENFIEESKGTFAWKTDFDSAGSFVFKVSASDGEDETIQQVSVEVQNVNRPPVILDVVQKT
ncbi:hypothetical protein HYT54_01010 [Candidatus Woesearchaeota archaeon]|nr:hypothetical protein [Candidatus Woesearchaeota archaeon]